MNTAQNNTVTDLPTESDTQPWVGTIAPPQQFDVIRAPVYVPDAGPVLRAGALDFKRIASHGFQC